MISSKGNSETVQEKIKALFKEARRLRISAPAVQQTVDFSQKYPAEYKLHSTLNQLEHVANTKLTANVQDYGRLHLHDLMHKASQSSIETIENEIVTLEKKLVDLETKYDSESKSKKEEAERLELSIKTLQISCAETLSKLVSKGKAKGEVLSAKHRDALALLLAEVQAMQSQLLDTQKSFKSEEKQLRKRRDKIYEELVAWKARYDSEIGEKQTEINAWKALFGTELDIYNELKSKYEAISAEFQKMQDEKEAELKRQRDIEEFIRKQNLSAAKIQAVWRGHKTRNQLKAAPQ